jgi:hypothetical protein
VEGIARYFIHSETVLYIYSRMDFLCEREVSFLCSIISFSCISVYKRPDDGSQLEPKHVAMNKLTKTSVLCVADEIYVFVAIVAPILSLIRSFHYI